MTETRAPYAGRVVPAAAACAHCAERDLRDEVSQLRVQVAELDSFNTDLLADIARLQAQLAAPACAHCGTPIYCPCVGAQP